MSWKEAQDNVADWSHRNSSKPESNARNGEQVVMRRRKPDVRSGKRNSGIETDVGDEMLATSGKIKKSFFCLQISLCLTWYNLFIWFWLKCFILRSKRRTSKLDFCFKQIFCMGNILIGLTSYTVQSNSVIMISVITNSCFNKHFFCSKWLFNYLHGYNKQILMVM